MQEPDAVDVQPLLTESAEGHQPVLAQRQRHRRSLVEVEGAVDDHHGFQAVRHAEFPTPIRHDPSTRSSGCDELFAGLEAAPRAALRATNQPGQLEVREARRRDVEAAPRSRLDARAARAKPLVGEKELELLGGAPRLGEVSGHGKRREVVIQIPKRSLLDEEPCDPMLDGELVRWPRGQVLEVAVPALLPASDGHELPRDSERRPGLGLERTPRRLQRGKEQRVLPREVSDGGR